MIELTVAELDGTIYKALFTPEHIVRAIPALESSKMTPKHANSEISLITGETFLVEQTGSEIKHRILQEKGLLQQARMR